MLVGRRFDSGLCLMSFGKEIYEGIMKAKPPKPTPVSEIRKNGLSSGSTLLNLAMTGSPFVGHPRGKYVFFVGDSASGKTFFCLAALAEACQNPAFDNYDLIYDNVEDGMLMDTGTLFGRAITSRLKPPAVSATGKPVFSEKIEDFYFHLDDAFKRKKPFVYICDSMDSLTSAAEGKKFDQLKDADRKGKKAPGSYGDGKAKINSAFIRKIIPKLRKTGSILIIIAQTRDILDAAPFQETKTRSGGRSLKFYATIEVWTSVAGQIKKHVRGKDRQIGHKIRIQIKKNRVTGRLNTVMTAIYPSYGIDDIGSCIDYLVEEKWWKKKGGKIIAGDFGMVARTKLIRMCENGQMKELQKEVGKCWRAIEQESTLERKPRYT